MKECPVCQAKAFDDASTCYGCMHRFGEKPAQPLPPAALQDVGLDEPAKGVELAESTKAAELDGLAGLPSFLITLTPPSGVTAGGSWTCGVELVAS